MIAGQTAENIGEIQWALTSQETLIRGLTGRQRDMEHRGRFRLAIRSAGPAG